MEQKIAEIRLILVNFICPCCEEQTRSKCSEKNNAHCKYLDEAQQAILALIAEDRAGLVETLREAREDLIVMIRSKILVENDYDFDVWDEATKIAKESAMVAKIDAVLEAQQ